MLFFSLIMSHLQQMIQKFCKPHPASYTPYLPRLLQRPLFSFFFSLTQCRFFNFTILSCQIPVPLACSSRSIYRKMKKLALTTIMKRILTFWDYLFQLTLSVWSYSGTTIYLGNIPRPDSLNALNLDYAL